MAATSTLLKLTPLQWNQSFSFTQQRHHPNVLFCSRPRLRSNTVRLQIDVKYKQSTRSDTHVRSDTNHAQILMNSFDEILSQIKKTLDSLKKPLMATVLLGLLLLCNHNNKCALAASGGRIGGNVFSLRSQNSKSSSSSSSKMYSKSKSSSSSSTMYYSTPEISEFPTQSFPYSPPGTWDQSPSLLYSGTSTWDEALNSLYSATSAWEEALSSPDGAPSFWNPIIIFSYRALIFSFWAMCCLYSFPGISLFALIWLGITGIVYIIQNNYVNDDTQKTSVLKVQVGLLGSARTLQKDFNLLAEKADTSTSEGLSYVLTEATLALLRHPEYCISSYSSVDVKSSIEEGEKRLNQFSVEERGKFNEETLVNVNNIKIQSSKIQKASISSNEYIVVTILVAAEGTHKLQTINGIADLKEALQKLGSIPCNKILAVELMWTPQSEKDLLSEMELLEDYPHLKSF